MNTTPLPDAVAASVSPSVLPSRLESIRLALGCDRLAVVRRMPSADRRPSTPLTVLAQVGPEGAVTPPEKGLPLEFVVELATQARPLEYRLDRPVPGWSERLQRWEVGWIAGWPLPSDRFPTVFFVALAGVGREPGPVRREVARAGMEALARLLAPPTWLPLNAAPRELAGAASGTAPSPGPDSEVEPTYADLLAELEREILMGALIAAEGNKSLAARNLRISRQGLYRKLRRHGLLPRTGRALDTGSTDD